MSWTTHPVDHIMDPWIHSSCVLGMVMPRVRVLEAKQHGLRVRRSIYAALHSSGSPRAPMDPSIHPIHRDGHIVTERESLCLSVVTRHPDRMYRDLHGNHHSTWIPGSSPLVVDTTSCCCPSLLTYTTCGAWLSSSSLCESVSSMLMDSSGVLRWIPSIWSSGDVHPGW